MSFASRIESAVRSGLEAVIGATIQAANPDNYNDNLEFYQNGWDDLAESISQAATALEAPTVKVTEISSSATLTESQYLIEVDNTGGAVTLTLPASEVGKVYEVVLAAGAFDIVVDGNGTNINGAATSTILVAEGSAKFIRGTSQWWRRA